MNIWISRIFHPPDAVGETSNTLPKDCGAPSWQVFVQGVVPKMLPDASIDSHSDLHRPDHP